MLSVSTRIDDQNCCFRVKQSDSCAQVKSAGASIVAALTAITLAGSVLLILSQQGFDLAGINSIAQMVEPKWLYLGMGIAGAVALIDITFIIAQVYSYLNKTVSAKELPSVEFFERNSKEHIIEQLSPKSFAALRLSTFYIIVSKDDDDNASYIAYHTQEESDYHQTRLLQEGYENLNEIQANSQEHSPDYIKALIGSERFQQWENDFSNDIKNDCYRITKKSINFGNISAWPLAFRDYRGIHVRFFKTNDLRNAALENEYTDFWNVEELDLLDNKEYTYQVLVSLQKGEFWPYESKLGTHYIYFVAFHAPDEEHVRTRYFSTKDNRSSFINDLIVSGSVNAKDTFFETFTYTQTEVTYLAPEREIQNVEAMEVPDLQYEKVNLPMQGCENQWLYALKTGGDSPIAYFKTDRLRQDHIVKNLQGFVNSQLVRYIEKEAYADLIHQALELKDFWCLPLVEDVVCIYYLSKEGLKKHILKSHEINAFKNDKGLEQDLTGQLPKKLVEFLAQNAGLADPTELFPTSATAYLPKGEYTFWPPVKTAFPLFPFIYTVHAKQIVTGAIKCFYFANELTRNKMFLENRFQMGI